MSGTGDRYLRVLLLLLVSATFFEGYDVAILSLVLPDIQDTFVVTESTLGISRGLIELGLFFAFFITRLGDRFGRRSLLLWSVLGYTVMTTLTAFSWDIWSFTLFQSLARVFLGAEYAVAVTMIVEEFPADRRAWALGRLLMFGALGNLSVAVLLLAGVDRGPLEWRTLYLIGVIPLLILSVLRRKLRETRRFAEYASARRPRTNFFEPWKPLYRRNLLVVGSVHLFRSLPLFGSIAWFFYYAEREAGLEERLLYVIFLVSFSFGIAGYWVCGVLMERIGRRATALLYGSLSVTAGAALFQASHPLVLGALLLVAVFFGLGGAPVLGAMSTELFPTHIRNQSAAWARNVFEIAGFILGPVLVGVLGDHATGAIGSIGDSVSLLFVLALPGIWLVWRHLPETRGRELEDITEQAAAAGLLGEVGR